MRPGLVARVLGRWLRTRLTFGRSLVERNFADGRTGEWNATMP